MTASQPLGKEASGREASAALRQGGLRRPEDCLISIWLANGLHAAAKRRLLANGLHAAAKRRPPLPRRGRQVLSKRSRARTFRVELGDVLRSQRVVVNFQLIDE